MLEIISLIKSERISEDELKTRFMIIMSTWYRLPDNDIEYDEILFSKDCFLFHNIAYAKFKGEVFYQKFNSSQIEKYNNTHNIKTLESSNIKVPFKNSLTNTYKHNINLCIQEINKRDNYGKTMLASILLRRYTELIKSHSKSLDIQFRLSDIYYSWFSDISAYKDLHYPLFDTFNAPYAIKLINFINEKIIQVPDNGFIIISLWFSLTDKSSAVKSRFVDAISDVLGIENISDKNRLRDIVPDNTKLYSIYLNYINFDETVKVRYINTDLLELLLKQNCNQFAENIKLKSPLHIAIDNFDITSFNQLINNAPYLKKDISSYIQYKKSLYDELFSPSNIKQNMQVILPSISTADIISIPSEELSTIDTHIEEIESSTNSYHTALLNKLHEGKEIVETNITEDEQEQLKVVKKILINNLQSYKHYCSTLDDMLQKILTISKQLD